MIYVGETQDLAVRIAQHRADKTHKMHRYAPAFIEFELITAGETVRRQREQRLIAEYSPPANA
jgi:predicted GIY-YIG superfamily endonuclease